MRRSLARKREKPARPLVLHGCPLSMIPGQFMTVFRAFDECILKEEQKALDEDMTRMIREGEELENQQVEGATIRTH